MSSPSSPPSTSAQLFHISLNDSKPNTIILLHGLSSSHREWAKIAPSLSEYHLLVPDLPGHRSSDHLGPFTLSNASQHVANLIRAQAHNSSCHVVGFSGGGFVAVELANRCPELVQSTLVSGVYSMKSRRRLLEVAPYLAIPFTALQCALPISFSSYVSGTDFPPELLQDVKFNNKFKLVKEGCQALLEMGEGYPLKTRSLAICATKHDDLEGTRTLGQIFRKGNPNSRAVKIEGAVHGWGINEPDLFAESIRAWAEDTVLPYKLEDLN